MKDRVIAVRGESDALSPVMPYVAQRFCGGHFSRLAKYYLEAALCRCGFDILDCPDGVRGAEFFSLAIRRSADAVITLSYAMFGSGRTFNDVRGFCVHVPERSAGRDASLGEDICAKLLCTRTGELARDLSGAMTLPNILVECGYATDFDEAKLIFDCDFAVETAERIAIGVCEHFDMPYVRRDDISAYPMLSLSRRGKTVKMLQSLLCANDRPIAIDGVFGGATEKTIKAFCADNGKAHTGGAYSSVWRDLLLSDIAEVELGSKGSAVTYIQRKLKSKLYYAGDIDGTLGKATLDAINVFLEENVGADCSANDRVTTEIFRLLSPIGEGRRRLF